MPGRLTRVPPHPARRPCCAEPYGRMWSMFPRSTCCRCLVGPHWCVCWCKRSSCPNTHTNMRSRLPSRPVLICTYLMLLVPIFVLFVYSIVLAVEAWQSVVFILVCSLPVSCLTITACKDPGAQRRCTHIACGLPFDSHNSHTSLQAHIVYNTETCHQTWMQSKG